MRKRRGWRLRGLLWRSKTPKKKNLPNLNNINWKWNKARKDLKWKRLRMMLN